MHNDLVETERSEAEKRGVRKELKAARRKLDDRTELEKGLIEKANRCKALKKEMELEMNTVVAKYKDQIGMLKDEIERSKVDLQHSYEQKGDLTKKDEELA
ncbi:hypothetical protein ACOSQ2_028591 [Xanthoceras sorbifolium]